MRNSVGFVFLFAGLTAIGGNRVAGEQWSDSVAVKHLRPCHLVCVEHRGDTAGDGEIYDVVLSRLLAWAVPARIWDFPGATRLMLVYPDDAEDMPPDQRRLWMGITVPGGTEVPKDMFFLDLPGGEYAVGSFELAEDEFGRAWGYLLGEWIPENGLVPGEGYSFEEKKNDSDLHPGKKHLVDICIPVRAAP